jgi:hypothetical protein
VIRLVVLVAVCTVGGACWTMVSHRAGGWRRMSWRRRVAWWAVPVLQVLAFALPHPWDIVALGAAAVAWLALVDDDHWPRRRRRVKARLKRGASLAWGVPARRPEPA